nr:putative di- and tripeptidase dug2 [Quercus suber]
MLFTARHDCSEEFHGESGKISSRAEDRYTTHFRSASKHTRSPQHQLPESLSASQSSTSRARIPLSTSAGSETDDPFTPTISDPRPRQEANDSQGTLPTLSHRLGHDSSILAIALSDEDIYAGTQGGEILVYSLNTFEKRAVIEGHQASVLGISLSSDQKLLFSSAGDRIVNVWNTKDFTRACCLYSSFDVGDVFCLTYSATLQTVYLGCQNTTIQWCHIGGVGRGTRSHTEQHPSLKDDWFFDSAGPGGIRTPRPAKHNTTPKHAHGGEMIGIPKSNVKHFAHNGYVYCMLLAKDGTPDAAAEETIITGGGDGVIKFWRLDAKHGGALTELYSLDDGREEGHSVLSTALDGTFLFSARSGGEIDVWDLETRQLVRNLKAHRDDVLTICVGGGFMFSAAVTGYIRKFDKQYQLKGRLKAHNGRILASAFTFYKKRPIYVTGGNDNTLAIWDVKDCLLGSATSTHTSNEVLFETLRRFVAYRTVSSDPTYQSDCRRGASFLKTVFKNFGAMTEMLPTSDRCNPVIFARFRGNPATANKRKKILFYGHYDVVAADNTSGKWKCDPFAMEGIDGYLYGRGTSDNKGPIMAAIFACAELISEQALGSDIMFLIEGEEESGSRGFEKAIKSSRDKIGDVDWILLANSYWLDDRIPCLTYGLRGVIHATVQIESSHPDMHSGVDGSAELNESLKDLVQLLSTLTGSHGTVQIPGFYDPVLELTEEEKGLYEDITSALVQRNPELGDPQELAASLMRKWREASLTIHRFRTSGPDNATIIPRLASVALSMRLVPNQEATEVAESLVKYLHEKFEKTGSTNQLTVTVDHIAEPWLGDWTNEIYRTLDEAIVNAWGSIPQTQHRRVPSLKESLPQQHNGYFSSRPSPTTSSVLANGSAISPLQPLTPLAKLSERLVAIETDNHIQREPTHDVITSRRRPSSDGKQRSKPLYIREGGSIPAIRFLEKEFDAPAAHLPCGQASDSAHLYNERFRLINLYKSKDIFKQVFRELPQKPAPAVLPQYGLLGFNTGDDDAGCIGHQEPIMLNVNAPNSTFICGSQGSGKSYTLSTILESCLLSNPAAGTLVAPVAGVVFHFDTDSGAAIAEAANLCSRGIPVRVLVSKSNFKALASKYLSIPGTAGSVGYESIKVDKLELRPTDLSVERMYKLMAFSEKSGSVPLYMDVIQRILREQAVADRFNYYTFRDAVSKEGFSKDQMGPMNLRFGLLDSFMVDRKSSRKHGPLFDLKPGTLTIIDLSDPFLDAATVCVLFDICLSLVKENRPRSGLVVALDEAHKYMDESAAATNFTDRLLRTIREQRHNATRVIIATQEPTISEKLLDLCSISIVHRFTSPAWFHAIKDHLGGASGMTMSAIEQGEMFRRIVDLQVGQSFVFSPSAFLCCEGETGVKKLGTRVMTMLTRKRDGVDGGKSELAILSDDVTDDSDGSDDTDDSDDSDEDDAAPLTKRMARLSTKPGWRYLGHQDCDSVVSLLEYKVESPSCMIMCKRVLFPGGGNTGVRYGSHCRDPELRRLLPTDHINTSYLHQLRDVVCPPPTLPRRITTSRHVAGHILSVVPHAELSAKKRALASVHASAAAAVA